MCPVHKVGKGKLPKAEMSYDIVISRIGNTLSIHSQHPLEVQQSFLINALLMITGRIAQAALLNQMKSDTGLITPDGKPIVNFDKSKEN